MTRDFSKPLTVLLAGSADSTTANIEDNLLDWMFGTQDSRDVTVVVPYRPNMGGGMSSFLVWGNNIFQWDQEGGDPLLAAVAPEGGHKSISHAKKTYQAENYAEAMGWAIGQLTSAREDGHEVAVISFYNPDDEEDLYLITAAKQFGLPTYDLAMSMVDNFPGFKTEEELEAEAKAKEEFDKTLNEVVAEKKVSAPRKRAAKKTAASNAPKTLEVQEKPLEDVPVGTTVVVAGMEFTKHSESPFVEPTSGVDEHGRELSATVTVPRKGPNPHRAPLPGNPMHDQPVKTVPASTMTVAKSDFVSLAESMQKMGEGFTEAIAALTRIVEGQ